MESKKITQLATEVAPLLDDLTFIGDPITGQLKKVTLNQIAYIFGAGSAWGTITGTLSNQTDLQAALNLKANDNSVVHLTGDETITGFKNFYNIILNGTPKVATALVYSKGGSINPATIGINNMTYAETGNNNLVIEDALSKAKLQFVNSVQTYTFPAATGTIALTSNLSAYVTLAGFETITGEKFFTIPQKFGAGIQISRTTGGVFNVVDYMTLYSPSTTENKAVFGFIDYSATLNFDKTGNRTYTFPTATGTLALTSDLTPYALDANVVHLAGAETITGAKSFTGNVFIDTDHFNYKFQTGLGVTSGYMGFAPTQGAGYNILNYTDGNNGTTLQLLYGNAVSRQYDLPTATNGQLALTSDLTSFITLTSLSATSPLAYNNTTGAFSIQVANTSQNGYLSSTDWTTFNNKQNALTNPVTGTGTTNYVPKFTGTSAIGDSLIQSSTYAIGIGGGVASWDLNYRSINLYGINNYITGADNGALYLGNGAYFNSGWKYSNGNSPTQISMETGSFTFKVALGGTTGNAISWITGLSVAAGTGNVIIGGATDAGYKLDVNGTLRVTGASTLTGRVTGVEMGVGRDGSDSVAAGPFFRWTNAAVDRQMLTQLNASNGLTTWAFNGTSWASIYTLASTGAATFSSSVTAASNFILSGNANSFAVASIFRNANRVFFGGDTGGYFFQNSGNTATVLQIADSGAATFSSSVNVNTYLSLGTGSGKFLAVGGAVTSGSSADMLMYNTGGDLNFWATGGVGMIVKGTSGNVGIGTISPSSLLHVGSYVSPAGLATPTAIQLDNTYYSGTATFDKLKLYLFKSSTESYGFNVADQSDLQYWAGTTASGMHRFFTSQTERMRITSAGQVLIGTTSATVEGNLQVLRNGSFWNTELFHTFSTQYFLRFAYNSTAVGSIIGNGSSVSYNTTSDYRLKEDLKEINGLEKVSSIRVYNYKWKNSENRMDGVIAHELQEVLPYAVSGEKDAIDKEGNISPQGVDYSKIVPVLVKAIQEQQAQIEELKALINK